MLGVFQCELEWLQCVIKAQQFNGAGQTSRCSQNRQSICGGAQANIPYDKISLMALQPLFQLKLADVKCFGLCDRPNYGMKSLSVSERVNAIRPAGQPHYSVTIAAGL